LTKFLISKLIKNHKAITEPGVRAAYGKLAGGLGIVCNLVLFVIKFIAGFVSGSVAVMSDAFNNLSDMGSSVVSLIGTIAASQHADEEHPFGQVVVDEIHRRVDLIDDEQCEQCNAQNDHQMRQQP